MHTSTPNAQYGGFFHSGTPSIQHTPYSTHFTSSTLSHHSTPIPSSSWSISPYDPPQQGLAFHQTAPTVQKMQHGGLVHSPLYSSGSYLTLSMPSGGSLMSSYGAPQQGVALHQTAPVAPHHQLGNNSTWHSGMSPQKYEVVVLKPSVKTCYGCGSPFIDKYRSFPYNLVVKHIDRRVTGKNDHTGQLLYSRVFVNTYYHLVKSHIQQRNPELSGFVYLSTDLYLSGLDEEQRALLQSCDLQLLVQ